MAIAAGAVIPLDEKRRRRHDLLAQLREVDHWRRLVAARLDLAVAAVTAIDEPDIGTDDRSGATLPHGLREMLGLPACDQALPEAAVLMRLRAAQRDLDEYAKALRESSDLATLELASLLDAERVAQRATRRSRRPRSLPDPTAEPTPGTTPGTTSGSATGSATGSASGTASGDSGPRPGKGPHLHVVTSSEG